MLHGEVFDGAVGGFDVQHFAFAAAVEDSLARCAAAEGNEGIDHEVAVIGGGREDDPALGGHDDAAALLARAQDLVSRAYTDLRTIIGLSA